MRTVTPRTLDFDLETIAAGFADPQWVPQKITCVAWSWIGSDEIDSRVCGVEGIYNRDVRRNMLLPFLEALGEADMVTGHNLLRFDLPILNAECMRLDLSTLKPVKVQDTMRFSRTKGFKKGQDNLAGLLQTMERKLSLDWQQWEDAYEESDWGTIRERAVSDVRMHKQMRVKMIKRGWLKNPIMWNPS